MRLVQSECPTLSFLLAIACQPFLAGTIAIEALDGQSLNDLSFSVKTQTKSVLEILILAIPPPRCLGENRLGDRLFGYATVRLCIPAFEGKHSEVFVFKTPHHRDFQTDRYESMVNVALATAAAPTYFRPFEHGGYTLVDGGVWANNPIMPGGVVALLCFDIGRDQI